MIGPVDDELRKEITHGERNGDGAADASRGRIARSEVHYPDPRSDPMNAPTDRTTFLRRSLQLDGIASGLCGVLLLAGARHVSALMGLAGPGIARVVGALLVVYAAALLYNAARVTVSRIEVVAAVAAAVLLFTLLEVVGLTRLREMAG
jgi:hypothetical protein